MFELTEEEFKEVVAQAMDSLPDEFKAKMENIEVVIEDFPPAEIKQQFPRGRLILGLYQGIPHTRRTSHYGLVMPDKISLYKRNIERVSASREQAYRQIRKTLLHEVGHHFSLSDDDLYDIGW